MFILSLRKNRFFLCGLLREITIHVGVGLCMERTRLWIKEDIKIPIIIKPLKQKKQSEKSIIFFLFLGEDIIGKKY